MFEFIRKRRLKAVPKITLQELAESSGVAFSTIHDIESGRTKQPGYLTMQRIEDALQRLEANRTRQGAATGG